MYGEGDERHSAWIASKSRRLGLIRAPGQIRKNGRCVLDSSIRSTMGASP